jgi:hypothetical protein
MRMPGVEPGQGSPALTTWVNGNAARELNAHAIPVMAVEGACSPKVAAIETMPQP